VRPAAIRAGAFALAFLAVYAAAVLTPLGQQIDAASLGAFGWLPAAARRSAGPVRLGLAGLAIGLALATVVVLLARRRYGAAARAVAVGAGTMAVAELLKQLVLPRPDFGAFGYARNTFPSGHVAFTAVVVGVVLRLAPVWFGRRWRRGAALAFVVVAALAEPVSYAHRASDSLGGLLIAGAGVALFRAVPPGAPFEASAEGPLPPGRRRRGIRLARLLMFIAFLVALALLVLADPAGMPPLLGIAIVILVILAAFPLVSEVAHPALWGSQRPPKQVRKTR
jgi:hypothetical protein